MKFKSLNIARKPSYEDDKRPLFVTLEVEDERGGELRLRFSEEVAIKILELVSEDIRRAAGEAAEFIIDSTKKLKVVRQ